VWAVVVLFIGDVSPDGAMGLTSGGSPMRSTEEESTLVHSMMHGDDANK